MAYHKLKIGDRVRILEPKSYPGDEPYPTRAVGMIGVVSRIEQDLKYPYYLIIEDDTSFSNYGFLRCELEWLKDYKPPNQIKARIKKLYGKCKTTAHWAV